MAPRGAAPRRGGPSLYLYADGRDLIQMFQKNPPAMPMRHGIFPFRFENRGPNAQTPSPTLRYLHSIGIVLMEK